MTVSDVKFPKSGLRETRQKLSEFVTYAKSLKGDERGEAQVFCDRFFQAFGHKGYKEANAELESRVKRANSKRVSFADLIWKPRLLLEMKKRGENLYNHYNQAFEYWINAVPNRPRYVILCNFDEFWIYDFDKQIDQPVDKLEIEELPQRYDALNFMFPNNPKPNFGNNMEEVSRDAADKVALLFSSLINRGTNREDAQRFVLQILVAMFSESVGLLPLSMFKNLVEDCLTNKSQNSYDLFGNLFRQMNTPEAATGGRFKQVRYFNGGIFQRIRPVELNREELELIGGTEGVANKDWSKVNPSIFGVIFQQSMDANERHAHGAHYTSESDMLRAILPTIVQPWKERINRASSMSDLLTLRKDLMNFKVLDPACGSGNFLYLSYRELVRIEIALMTKLRQTVSERSFHEQAKAITLVSPKQFFGIDQDSFGVELAKITLMIAKKLATDEAIGVFESKQMEMQLQDESLPLDNLDSNFKCDDALFTEWPEVDAIVGNPPFQSKNKMVSEFGRVYVNKVRKKFPEVPGRADYCVYWFRKAHDHLKPGQRAGLVGTNTIGQNNSRVGGLEYIVKNSGTITEAVSSQVWSGEANVHVSIVNWIKGSQAGKKKLLRQVGKNGESNWEKLMTNEIGPSLSFDAEVWSAEKLKANTNPKHCFQGQTHGHEGFLISSAEALKILDDDQKSSDVLHPYLIANDLFGTKSGLPSRFVIDFGGADLLTAKQYKKLFSRVEKSVLEYRKGKAADQERENELARQSGSEGHLAKHHSQALRNWWNLFWRRDELMTRIKCQNRYIACSSVTSRAIFEFISPEIHPNASLTVFAFEDDYSFGVLQSEFHCSWFVARCSTLASAPRYTGETVFNSFPWPQSPDTGSIKRVAAAAAAFRKLRNELKEKHGISLREVHKSIENPGSSQLKDAKLELDKTVREAYGMKKNENPLKFLLDLNKTLADKEKKGELVIGPGLPSNVKSKSVLETDDCVRMRL